MVAPVTASALLWVNAPLVVTFKAPETVEAPRTNALVSSKVTLLALVTETVLKLLPAESRTMSLAAPAAKEGGGWGGGVTGERGGRGGGRGGGGGGGVVAPVTTTLPLSVMSTARGHIERARHRGSAEVEGIGILKSNVSPARDRHGAEVVPSRIAG